MLAHAHDDVKVALWAAQRAGIAAPWNTYALSVARARLDSHLDRLVALYSRLSVTHRTDSPILTATSTARAGNFKLHAAALLGDRALAMALWTFAGLLDVTLTVTIAARLKMRNAQLQ